MIGQTLTIRKMLPVSREEVFDAWLDGEGMSHWMCPGPVTSSEVMLEPRVGGHFRIVMSAPNTQYVNTGEFRLLERPSTLQFTWISSRMGNEETLITIELLERGTDCELVLTHERFPQQLSVPELERGWGQILEKLVQQIIRQRAVNGGI